jgi:phosphoadenosine phosphosulfate reductase
MNMTFENLKTGTAMNNLKSYQTEIANFDAPGILAWALSRFGLRKIALASSFSAEDQVLTHMLVNIEPRCRVFTLDTGRHFQETYDIWQKSVDTWHINYEICSPNPEELAQLIAGKGPNLFYGSVEARKACCAIRKTHPLRKVLSTVDAWIVGLRSEQAVTRSGLSPLEWDSAHGICRISPLYNWSEAQVFDYGQKHSIPISVLYEKGFRSIGCAPCTRAISPNDDVRAGRWWWEAPEHKECGLHTR